MKQRAYDENVFVPSEVKRTHLGMRADYRDSLYTDPILKKLFIEMTVNCNQYCRHCGSRCGDIPMEDQLTDDEILDFLRDLKARTPVDPKTRVIKLPQLNITGGEPLVRKGFTNLMKQISELGYIWGMTSNGLLIDEEMNERLHEAGMRTVSISLDGLEETHDWFRNSKGGYQKAISAVKTMANSGYYSNVMVTTVVHKKNIDELDEIYEVVKGLGCQSWRIVNVDPIGRALEDEEIRLEKGDYKRIIDYIVEKRAADNRIDVTYGCNHYLGVDLEREARRWYFMCGAGTEVASITYNGDIGACLDIERRPETTMGNIRKDDFLEVWQNKFQIFRQNRALKSEKCKDCPEKRFCAGGGFHTWNIDENEPRICMAQEIGKLQ